MFLLLCSFQLVTQTLIEAQNLKSFCETPFRQIRIALNLSVFQKKKIKTSESESSVFISKTKNKKFLFLTKRHQVFVD